LKGSVTTAIATLVLSLLVWIAFYALNMPLKPDDTLVVVGVCAGIAFLVKWAFGLVRNKEH